LQEFNGTSYIAATIPFPLRGELELTGYAEGEEQLFEEVSTAGEENEASAHLVKKLEEEIEKGLDECFRLDIYKPAGTQRAYWDPAQVLQDFRRGFSELQAASPSVPSTPVPIENTAQNRQRLSARFVEDYRRLGQSLREKVVAHFGQMQVNEAGVSVRDIDAQSWLASEKSQRVYLLEHKQGDRRAYHQNTACFGLAGAKAAVQTITVGDVLGHDDHPPCVLCAPAHWRALEAWQKELGEFARAWNAEAAALRAWQKAREQLEEEQGQITTRTENAFTSIVEEAGGFLMGGRLRYTPAGARGFLCVVASTSERSLPDFTLPALTGSANARLGQQVALSGARLMPSATESTIPSLLADSKTGAEAGLDEGLSGVTRALLSDGGGGGSSGGSSGSSSASSSGSGAFSFILGLWGTCLDLYTKGGAKLESAVSGLPLGLDSLMSSCLGKVADAANVSAPDLRRPQPTLVNTADIGDADVEGVEGAFCRALRAAKSGLERSGGASVAGFREAVRGAIGEMEGDVTARIDALTTIKILGVSIPLPFGDSIKSLCGKAFDAVRSKEEELFALLGMAGTW